MAQTCLPAGCIDAIRFALLDDCSDAPVAGANNGYIVNCVRNVTFTPNIEEGDETILENDCGTKCWQTKQCDELRNITLEFQLLNPDYELTNLLTGRPLINDGVENIGYYHTEGNPCHPWVSVELFEQVPDESCTAGHKYRRIVLPKVRFQPPGSDREAPFRVVTWTGMTSPSHLQAWGNGPYNDSPVDLSTVPDAVNVQYIEMFDDTITETLEGQCGFVTVPAQA